MAKRKKRKRKARKRSRPRNGNGFGTPIVKTAVGGVLAITVIKGVLG